MAKIDKLIGDVESVIAKLTGVRESLYKLREESQAVEKARDVLRGRGPKKNGDSN